ncbi:hypothetical protein GEV29_07655 [Aeromicrobium sp. SMF47]|uniref:SAV_915 family protein n=1 Tax=Aeromicrobium yanjiei TaxID=2662028 RepID=UPI00129E9E41|nr:SAV_915 family protein [Aeromicrobium yanjiei]MRJ76408.1 hypothetical protein [Aeromicrobium yanjiei]
MSARHQLEEHHRMKTLVVPVRRSPLGTLTPMTARQKSGTRVGIAFSSIAALEAVQPGRDWIRLSEGALHALLAPLDIVTIQVDPQLIVADLRSSAPDRPLCA